MNYNFSRYIQEENEQEYLRFAKVEKEEPITKLGEKLQDDFINLLTLQKDIGKNKKNVERKYAALNEQKMQKHANPEHKRSVCKIL